MALEVPRQRVSAGTRSQPAAMCKRDRRLSRTNLQKSNTSPTTVREREITRHGGGFPRATARTCPIVFTQRDTDRPVPQDVRREGVENRSPRSDVAPSCDDAFDEVKL